MRRAKRAGGHERGPPVVPPGGRHLTPAAGFFLTLYTPMKSLRETTRWRRTAFHEAGHAVVARLHGAGNKHIVVRDDYRGEVVHSFDGISISAHDRASISVAGAIAEARFVDPGHPCFPGSGANWKRFMSGQDWENVITLAESACIPAKHHALFLDNIARSARTMLDYRWSDVERVVSFLYESAGPIRLLPGARLLYESAAPPPPPKPAPAPDITAGLGRLARRAAELWSADSPHEAASHRRLYEANSRICRGLGREIFEASADTDGGWITIGAHRGADGKRHGGTPVKIKGGKITHGPPGLAGKTLRGLSKTKPHVELRRAINKAHKEHGFSKSDIADAIEFVHGERKRLHDERESNKVAIRKATGLTAGDISHVANSGHDYSSAHKMGGATGRKFDTFDEAAHNMAREYPGMGLGDPDNPRDNFSENLWNLLAEGKQEAPAKHHVDTVDEAIQLLHQNARYKTAGDEVPF